MNRDMRSEGFPVLRVVDIHTGKVIRMQRCRNTTCYEGADILGRIMAGQTNYIPSVMYFEFENGGSFPAKTADREGRSYYAAVEASATRDYLRVPIVRTPDLSAQNASFATNVVTWYCQNSVTLGQGGKVFSEAALSTVYGLALVAAPDPDDRTEDLVYAKSYDFTAEAKDANHQLSATWPIRFG